MPFSEDSRVWVYQSDRPFTPGEITSLQARLDHFCNEWTAHNNQLKAKAEIRYATFILLMVDESQAGATGCSIDKSVRLMLSIEEELHVKLFDRMLFAYKENGQVRVLDRNSFQNAIEAGTIKNDTLVFNNLVKTKAELDSSWEIPLAQSWHADFFKTLA